jgi:hypothetical protein
MCAAICAIAAPVPKGGAVDTEDVKRNVSREVIAGLLPLLLLLTVLIGIPLAFWVAVEMREYLSYPTRERLKQLIETELPPGTEKADVISFLDRHRIGHAGYHRIPLNEKGLSMEFEEDKLKKPLDRLEYRIYSGGTVSNWRSITGCWVTVWFYFDDNGRLVEYVLHNYCDG